MGSEELKPLPTSKSDIAVILENNMLYVDKTRYVYEMIKNPGCYFLSRPRRFGKSMLLSTFEKVFQADKELFKEQWIYNSPWQWDTYPIIRLDFNVAIDTDLKMYIKDRLRQVAIHYGIFDEKYYENSSYDNYFNDLVKKLYTTFKEIGVVVLIDEYDKPILDVIENIELAEKKRDTLKGFYTVMKGLDDELRFVFLTGVSRFSKVGVFSGLNNLKDISMLDNYSDICGISQEELEYYGAGYIQALADKESLTYTECLEKVKSWYNGFCFSRRGLSVYNPYSTMNVLEDREFKSYWFSSGNASFLIKLMKQQDNLELFQLDEYKADMSTFDTFDIENLNIIAILFQAGYLTIKRYNATFNEYILSYPNQEVSQSFKRNVLSLWSKPSANPDNALLNIAHALTDNHLVIVMNNLKRIFVNLDYDIQLSRENNYQSIFYLIFQLLGFYIKTEYKTALGRIDALVETKSNIYVFEFKLDKSAKEALDQIKGKDYALRFADRGKPVYLIGANFNSEKRNIDDYIIEEFKN